MALCNGHATLLGPLWLTARPADNQVGRLDRSYRPTSPASDPVEDAFLTNRRGAAAARPETETDVESRFRNLVQSPLRAGILRYLSARPEESFEVDALMQMFGRLRLD